MYPVFEYASKTAMKRDLNYLAERIPGLVARTIWRRSAGIGTLSVAPRFRNRVLALVKASV